MNTDYATVIKEASQHYNDQVKRFSYLNEMAKFVISKASTLNSSVKNALDLAEACHARDSSFLTVRWRPTYPFTKDDANWDADDAYDYENSYFVELNIAVNGIEGNYSVQFGWNVNLHNAILMNESAIMPLADVSKKLEIPAHWLKALCDSIASWEAFTKKNNGFFQRLFK